MQDFVDYTADVFNPGIVQQDSQPQQQPAFDPNQFVPKQDFEQFQQKQTEFQNWMQSAPWNPASQQVPEDVAKARNFVKEEGLVTKDDVAKTLQQGLADFQSNLIAQQLGFQSYHRAEHQAIDAMYKAIDSGDPAKVAIVGQMHALYKAGDKAAFLQAYQQHFHNQPTQVRSQSFGNSPGQSPMGSQQANQGPFTSNPFELRAAIREAEAKGDYQLTQQLNAQWRQMLGNSLS